MGAEKNLSYFIKPTEVESENIVDFMDVRRFTLW